jgi:hypothetical protein
VEIEIAVAESITGLNQCSHGCSVQATMFAKTPFGLEAAEVGFGVTAKGALDYFRFLNRESELKQAAVEISNGFTAGPLVGLVVFRHDLGSGVRPGGPA